MMWVFDVETSIYSIVKTRAKKKLISNYPDIEFTNSDAVNDSAKFPTVYIHFLSSLELGQDLDNTEVNAIRSTVQIEVTVGGEKNTLSDAREVASVVLEEFKALRFNATAMPYFDNDSSDTKRLIFRASRVIGAQDTL